MSYGYRNWMKPKAREVRAVDEKAYRRQPLAAWDVVGTACRRRPGPTSSPRSRGPPRTRPITPLLTRVSASRFPAARPGRADRRRVRRGPGRPKSGASTRRVLARGEIYDFAAHVRTLKRLHLLASDQPADLVKYVNHVFDTSELVPVISQVLRKAGIDDFQRLEMTLQRYVSNFRWPGWVARMLDDPLVGSDPRGDPEAEGPLPLVELPDRMRGAIPTRSARPWTS